MDLPIRVSGMTLFVKPRNSMLVAACSGRLDLACCDVQRGKSVVACGRVLRRLRDASVTEAPPPQERERQRGDDAECAGYVHGRKEAGKEISRHSGAIRH